MDASGRSDTHVLLRCLLEKRKVQLAWLSEIQGQFLALQIFGDEFRSVWCCRRVVQVVQHQECIQASKNLLWLNFADETRQGRGVVCWPLLLLVCLRAKEAWQLCWSWGNKCQRQFCCFCCCNAQLVRREGGRVTKFYQSQKCQQVWLIILLLLLLLTYFTDDKWWVLKYQFWSTFQ